MSLRERERAETPLRQSIRPPWDRRRTVLALIALGLLVATAFSFRVTEISVSTFLEGLDALANLLTRMLPPVIDDPLQAVRLTLETFMIAVAGTFLAAVLSTPLAFLAARNTTLSRPAYNLARGVIVAARAIPDLVFALIFVRALGLGVLPGVLALALHSVGMVGKLFADAVEEIDEGPRHAAESTGASRSQTLLASVVPQVVPSFASTVLYRLDINVRTSVLLGFVGAGGIGFELQSSLRSLQYRDGLGLVVLIFVLIVGVERLSAALRRILISAEEPSPRLRRQQPTLPPAATSALIHSDKPIRPPWTSTRRTKAGYTLLFVAVVPASFFFIELSPGEFVASVPAVLAVVARFFPPDFAADGWALAEAMLETIAIGLAATFIGVLLSFPLAFLAAGNVAPARWIYYGARYLVVAIRGMPELVLAVIFVSAVGLGPFAGTMALAIASIGITAKLFADAIEQVRAGPREAVRTAGATRFQETAAAVFPQVLPSLVGTALYTLDVNVRTSVILGIVGAGGIGFLLQSSLRTIEFDRTGAILLVVFGVVLLIERLSSAVRSRIV